MVLCRFCRISKTNKIVILMKKIDPNKLPEILTPEIITILVEIAMEFPKKMMTGK